jgi:hypothetical protein
MSKDLTWRVYEGKKLIGATKTPIDAALLVIATMKAERHIRADGREVLFVNLGLGGEGRLRPQDIAAIVVDGRARNRVADPIEFAEEAGVVLKEYADGKNWAWDFPGTAGGCGLPSKEGAVADAIESIRHQAKLVISGRFL